MSETILQIAIGMIILPWCVWVSISIFQHRQELALLKQAFDSSNGLSEKIYEVLKNLDR